MNIKKENKGFTLVEIVIVLAIAALILAAILFAVQGAQESRRDASRRDSAGQIGALLEEYAGNHNGDYPAGTTEQGNFQTQANTRVQPPGGGTFTAWTWNGTTGACPTTAAAQDAIQVGINGRDWQVCMGLESGDWFRANN